MDFDQRICFEFRASCFEFMKIGIDISQIVHEGTGVGEYVRHLVKALLTIDQANEYVLFGASLRKLSSIKAYFEEVRVFNSDPVSGSPGSSYIP